MADCWGLVDSVSSVAVETEATLNLQWRGVTLRAQSSNSPLLHAASEYGTECVCACVRVDVNLFISCVALVVCICRCVLNVRYVSCNIQILHCSMFNCYGDMSIIMRCVNEVLYMFSVCLIIGTVLPSRLSDEWLVTTLSDCLF